MIHLLSTAKQVWWVSACWPSHKCEVDFTLKSYAFIHIKITTYMIGYSLNSDYKLPRTVADFGVVIQMASLRHRTKRASVFVMVPMKSILTLSDLKKRQSVGLGLSE